MRRIAPFAPRGDTQSARPRASPPSSASAPRAAVVPPPSSPRTSRPAPSPGSVSPPTRARETPPHPRSITCSSSFPVYTRRRPISSSPRLRPLAPSSRSAVSPSPRSPVRAPRLSRAPSTSRFSRTSASLARETPARVVQTTIHRLGENHASSRESPTRRTSTSSSRRTRARRETHRSRRRP